MAVLLHSVRASLRSCWKSAAGCLVVCSLAVMSAGCDAPQPAASRDAVDEHDHDHDHSHDDHDHGDHAHEEESHGADEHAGHDHASEGQADTEHEHPETLAEGVEVVRGLIAKVKSSLGGDDASEADGHVHDLGHLLVDLETKAETLEDDVKGAVTSLIDAFSELDEKIHDEADPMFDDIAEQVETAMATLDAYVDQLSKAAADAVTDDAPGDGEASDATDGDADAN